MSCIGRTCISNWVMTAKVYDEENAIKFNFVSAISMDGATKWFRSFARLDIISRKLHSKLLSLSSWFRGSRSFYGKLK